MGTWFGEDDTSVQMNRLPWGYPLSLGCTITLLHSKMLIVKIHGTCTSISLYLLRMMNFIFPLWIFLFDEVICVLVLMQYLLKKLIGSPRLVASRLRVNSRGHSVYLSFITNDDGSTSVPLSFLTNISGSKEDGERYTNKSEITFMENDIPWRISKKLHYS